MVLRYGSLLALTSVVMLTSGCSASAASSGSGITGRVVVAPTCPAERAGHICQRGFRATVVILRAKHHRRVTTFRSEADGRFRVRLPPGRYVMQGTRAGIPRLAPTIVTVHRRRFTAVTLAFDTGIR